MPLPAAFPAIAAAGASVIGSGINAFSQGRMNRKNRRFSREMYERQYQDSIDFWNRQNTYNTPKAQIDRLREAGLNPALMYGSSAGQASGQAGAINNPSFQTPQTQAPKYGNALTQMMPMLMQIANLKKTEAETNVVNTQQEYMKGQIILNRINSLSQWNKMQRDRDLHPGALEMQKWSAQAMEQKFRGDKIRNDYLVTEKEQEILSKKWSTWRTIAEIGKIGIDNARTKAEVEHIKELTNDKKFKNETYQFQMELKEYGYNPGDPWYIYFMALYFKERQLLPVKEIGKFIDNWKASGGKGLKEGVEGLGKVNPLWNFFGL